MREILLRGKRIDNGEWTTGDLLRFQDSTVIHAYVYGLRKAFKVDPDTVGQYTGLKDKNGKKIFEGDIVAGLFLFGMMIKAVVVFQDGAFGLKWHRGEVEEFCAFTSICNVEIEVVGNIHDNPELMEENDA